MSRPFIIFTLTLGFILDAFGNSEVDTREDQNEKNPTMECLLFDEQVCAEECRLKGLVYGVQRTNGFCDQDKTCQCEPGKVSFYQEWMKRFKADYVYHEILDRPKTYDEVQKLFRNPFRTAEQFKSLLRPIISAFQFTKLKVRDNSLAMKFTANNKLDSEAVQKHVSEQVDKLLKSTMTYLLNVKYKEKLTDGLKNVGRSTLYNITYWIGRLKNTTLDGILDEYLKKNNLERPKIELDEHKNLDDLFNDTFVNEIIKRIDQNDVNQINSPNDH